MRKRWNKVCEETDISEINPPEDSRLPRRWCPLNSPFLCNHPEATQGRDWTVLCPSATWALWTHGAPHLTHMFSLSSQSCFLDNSGEETPE